MLVCDDQVKLILLRFVVNYHVLLTIMEKLTADIKDVIESLACPEHNKHPTVVIDGEKITLQCCCPKCKAQCHYLINKIFTMRHPDSSDLGAKE